uniref:FAD-dependent oxidoreductase n=1 Tax=Staphylococcus capitis TaxID=29388 RepID=UPI00370963A8
MYVEGLSRSVAEDVQGEMLERIGGVEKGEMMGGGYGMEYDGIVRRELWGSVERK